MAIISSSQADFSQHLSNPNLKDNRATIGVSKTNMNRSRKMSEKGPPKDDLYSEISHKYSNFAIMSSGSKSKEVLFN